MGSIFCWQEFFSDLQLLQVTVLQPLELWWWIVAHLKAPSHIWLASSIKYVINLLKFSRIYDIDNDGYISNGELFQVLKMMVGSNLKDTQLQQIVDKTILFADKDEDGKINFEEFCEVVGNTDVHKKMVVDV